MRTFTDQQCSVIEVAMSLASVRATYAVAAGSEPAAAGCEGQGDGDDGTKREADTPGSIDERM
jgi:hypothetical protein